jgi:MFS family permease
VTTTDPESPARAPPSRRALAVVVAVVFLDLVGFGVVVPILPFYVRSFAVSDVFIGLLAASYSLAQFAAAPVLGRLSDARGRRPVIVVTLFGSAFAWVVFGLAGEVGAATGTVAGVATLFASRLLAGAMGGNLSVAQAYVADVTPRERRAGALGLLAASFSLGFVVGPALGGAAASATAVRVARDVLPAAVPATAFSLPSFAAAAMSLVSAVFAVVFLAEPARTRPAATGGFRAAVRVVLRDPSLRLLTLATLLVSVAFSGVQVMFVPFAADFYGYGATETAAFLTYIGVLGALNQGVLVGRLSRIVPPARLALAGVAGLTLALVVLPFSPALGRLLPPPGGPAWLDGPLVVLLAVGALLSVSLGFVNVSLSTLVSTTATEEGQGSAFGVTGGAGSLGRTVGPPLMAATYVVAFWSPFVAGAVLLVPVGLVVVGLARAGRAA